MSQDLSHQAIAPPNATTRDHVPLAVTAASVPVRAYVHGAPPVSAASVRKRKSSKMKSGRPLSRTTSTPHLRGPRGPIMQDADDKRRNKLGYQRISIACGHCRRRKIRCLVTDHDHQQRCQNCIRLKKECVFYPIDQQGEVTKHAPTKTSVGSDSSSALSPSPPGLGTAGSFDGIHEFGGYQPLPSNAPHDFDLLPLKPGNALNMPNLGRNDGMYPPGWTLGRTTAIAQSEYALQSTAESRGQWIPNFFASPTDHAPSNYWRPPELQTAGDFAPFPPSAPSQSPVQDEHPYMFMHQQNGPGWHPPIRSMSYSHIEGQRQTQFPPQGLVTLHPEPNPLQPLRYPSSSINMGSTSSLSSATEAQPAPTGVQTLTPFGQPPPPHWVYYHDDGPPIVNALPGHPGFQDAWYPESSPLRQLEEESHNEGPQGPSAYDGRPAMA